jgi:protein-tyrosine phosphatase
VPDRPYRVVAVCLGNICRSPMVELVLRRQLEEQGLAGSVEVTSAGTSDAHLGEPVDERAAAALRDAGYDPSGHSARQFRAEDVAGTDLILALDAANAAALRDLTAWAGRPSLPIRRLRSFDPDAVATGDLDVPDPYYGGADGFPRVLAMIEAACRGVVAELPSG